MRRVAMDLIYAAFFSILLGPPAVLVVFVARAIARSCGILWAAGAAPALYLLFLGAFIFQMFIVRLCLPRVRPGRYPFPNHSQVVVWGLHFFLQRIAYIPIWKMTFFSLAIYRTLLIRALGGKIDFDVDTSSDVSLEDPSLMDIAQGSMLGGGVQLTGHMIEPDEVLFGTMRIGRGAQVFGNTSILPGGSIGEYSQIGPESRIGPRVVVGAHTHLGYSCVIASDVTIADHVVVGHRVFIEADVVIGEGAIVASYTTVPRGTKIAEGERFPPRKKKSTATGTDPAEESPKAEGASK